MALWSLLDCSHASSLEDKIAPAETTVLETTASKPRPRILLAEDDALIALFLAEVLESMGYDVCAIVSTETDAIASAALHKPDVMIVDAHLGTGSGIVAVETILRDGFIPHVFATGDPPSILAHVPSAIVIQKPFRETDISLAIHQALKVQAVSPHLRQPRSDKLCY